MTVVPELDWMSAVTAPRATARQVDEVSFCRMLSILPPAYFSSPVPMMDMPYKNSARPPARLITLKMVATWPPGLSQRAFHTRPWSSRNFDSFFYSNNTIILCSRPVRNAFSHFYKNCTFPLRRAGWPSGAFFHRYHNARGHTDGLVVLF